VPQLQLFQFNNAPYCCRWERRSSLLLRKAYWQLCTGV